MNSKANINKSIKIASVIGYMIFIGAEVINMFMVLSK